MSCKKGTLWEPSSQLAHARAHGACGTLVATLGTWKHGINRVIVWLQYASI